MNEDDLAIKNLLKSSKAEGSRRSKSLIDDARDNYLLGQTYERKIEYQKAYEHFEKAVKFDPETPEYLSAFNSICDTLRKGERIMNEDVLAIENLSKSATAGENIISKESGDVARDNYLLGQIFEGKIEYEKAYEHFEKAVKLNPENSEYLSALNLICAKLRK